MKGLMGDIHWIQQLRRTPEITFTIHSIFDHAINILDKNHQLYTFVTEDVALAPNTIQIQCHSMPSLNLSVGEDLIWKQDLKFHHKKCIININQILSWNDEFPSYQPFDHLHAISLIEQILSDNLHEKKLKHDSIPKMDPFKKEIYQILDHSHRNFISAWQKNHFQEAYLSLQRSLGLGFGLTPSGDDAIIGLLAILAIPNNPAETSFSFLKNLGLDAKGNTTDVSAAALLHASRKRFSQIIIDCLPAFFQADTALLEQKLLTILSLGSTSGADILRGMKTGLMMFYIRSTSYVNYSSY
ncbi:oxamate carbamoyltransferase subunit AllH family protein [Ignatzschineria sp. LJL83]